MQTAFLHVPVMLVHSPALSENILTNSPSTPCFAVVVDIGF